MPVLADDPEPREDLASPWSDVRTVGYAAHTGYRGYFNRGFVISQFMSRYLDQHYPNATRDAALRQFKQDITSDVEDRIRVFLSGQIRTELLALLDEVDANGGEQVYAALFELADEQLLAGLAKLGSRAHVVLANGSVQVATDKDGHPTETTAEARTRDENEQARKALLDADVDVERDEQVRGAGAARAQQVPRSRRRLGPGDERLDGKHELDDDRPLHAAEQRARGRRSGRCERLPRAVARATRGRQRSSVQPGDGERHADSDRCGPAGNRALVGALHPGAQPRRPRRAGRRGRQRAGKGSSS